MGKHYKEFGSFLSEICSRSLLAPGRPLIWTIIANPKAGGFTIRSRWKKHHSMLQQCLQKAKANPLRDSGSSMTAGREGNNKGWPGLILTKSPNHAALITKSLLEEAASTSSSWNSNKPFYLIITAGGDGTSWEVMTNMFHAAPDVLEDFAVLRLPMGTGNDGSDSWDLDKALDLLILPAEIKLQRAVRLRTSSGKGPFLAFNILSVGLDAFVTHMTNKMKGKMPGDSYKLWVDLAALFYDVIYKVGMMDVKAGDNEGKEVKAFKEKILLLAVGESGRRTYGSHKWILPDDRNVCAIRQMSLLRKVALKELFTYGTHICEPEAMLWNSQSVEFSCETPILAQMDGETILLEQKDFPAVIELTDPVIPIIKQKKN